ncbi:hypothetical protein PMEGAS67_50650 [Priestia megaterium]
MNLYDIKGSYDAVFSLGSACNPALQFQRLDLKRFTSSPLDWNYSPFLSDVNRLLKNKFNGFMELKNMRVINDKGVSIYADEGVFVFPDKGLHKPIKSYLVLDTVYNIFSAHDFPIIPHLIDKTRLAGFFTSGKIWGTFQHYYDYESSFPLANT